MSFFKSTASYGKGFKPTKIPDEYSVKKYTLVVLPVLILQKTEY